MRLLSRAEQERIETIIAAEARALKAPVEIGAAGVCFEGATWAHPVPFWVMKRIVEEVEKAVGEVKR